MSQFDFPRINFHGSVLLDVPTANNGRFDPLRVYDQEAGLPYLPPRVYLTPEQAPYVQNTLGFAVTSDGSGSYVSIASVNTPEQWAVCNLGTCPLDASYKPLYDYVPLSSDSSAKLSADWISPGYWNYFGDLSVYVEDIRITGIQLPDGKGNAVTFTPENSSGCPDGLAQLLGQSFSFHQQFFDPDSRTTAMFCDVDSIGQTCTQLFYGLAGIYGQTGGQQKTFLRGKPCKSTFNWMSLCKVLNWNAGLLMPMSGSAYFNSTIQLDPNNTDSLLQQDLNRIAGTTVDALSMKILLHPVYEVHNPVYPLMPTEPLGNNQTSVPKNPARCAFSGSLCPYIDGDMTTHNIARILKNELIANPAIDTSSLQTPTPIGSNTPLTIGSPVQLPPAFVKVNTAYNVISLDVINTICEYGIGFGSPSPYGGLTSISPFLSFENYDFGTLTLFFVPDGGDTPTRIGQINRTNDYQMSEFLARGGVMDFPIPLVVDFSQGRFQICQDGNVLLQEDDYLILSDQQGSYAEQNQAVNNGYKSDGSNRGPVIIRAFYRGQSIPSTNPVPGVVQYATDKIVSTPFSFYDGAIFAYDVSQAGCMQYVFAITDNQKIPDGSNSNPNAGLYFAANGYSVSTRVLSEARDLDVYLMGQQPLTWDVVFNRVLVNYQTVVPIMGVILPFDQSTWSEPNILGYLLQFTDEKNWGEFMYMPVTRELSIRQRKLLQLWAKHILNLPISN
jgi:hypothetical protein